MPRGQADYGIYTITEMPAGISDPGEAAARLGSINVYDRRGWTLWMDDFEGTVLRWEAVVAGAGVVPVLDATRAVSGVQCAKLACGAVAGASSRLRRYFPLVRLGKIGIEFWLQAKSVVGSYLEVYVNVFDGTNWTQALMRYYPQAGTVYVLPPIGGALVASNVFMTQDRMYFLPIKLVVDMDTDYYTRLMVGERDIDISGYPLANIMATTDRNIGVSFYLEGVAAGTTEDYIDNFIFTVSEP